MSDLKNILSNHDKDINQEQLSNYLKGELSPEAAHDVEKHLVDTDDFENDAIEGLKTHDINVKHVLFQINHKIDAKLKNKHKKDTINVKQRQINNLAIWVILGLIVVGYIVIRYLKKV